MHCAQNCIYIGSPRCHPNENGSAAALKGMNLIIAWHSYVSNSARYCVYCGIGGECEWCGAKGRCHVFNWDEIWMAQWLINNCFCKIYYYVLHGKCAAPLHSSHLIKLRIAQCERILEASKCEPHMDNVYSALNPKFVIAHNFRRI